jgi:squalene-hopene/tetraprenyl-beta-curcumene cyclase
MKYRVAVLLGLSMLPAFAGDWSPRMVADYLDSRQKDWFAWPRANGGAKPCISCHTQLTYLMVRPALRQVLGEPEPTQWETGLLESMRSRIEKRTPDGAALGVESVMSALFLRSPAAFDRMWALQVRDGKLAGGWKWYMTDLDPWEEPESELFGAALGALAVGSQPEEYRAKPEIRERIAALTAYLRTPREGAPLQNRLAVAWASATLPEAMDAKDRQAVIREAFDKQESDGGWGIASLGPWKKHPEAPEIVPGSTGYATAFTTLVLLDCGIRPTDPRMTKALHWLRTHQDREGGYWNADSLNHQYKPDSMEIKFMRDAATGFAALALIKAEDGAKRAGLQPQKLIISR